MRNPALTPVLPPADTAEQPQIPQVIQRNVAPIEICGPASRQDRVPREPVLNGLKLGCRAVRVLAACSAAYASIVGDIPPPRDDGQRPSYATTERLKGPQQVAVDEGRTVPLRTDLVQAKIRRDSSPLVYLV